ncbi:MAG TPA: hypothetical protein VEY30_03915, partial [Myxococcaceae bacterium]|nr:hypothetical protein [Myxococcaceae bacterium]
AADVTYRGSVSPVCTDSLRQFTPQAKRYEDVDGGTASFQLTLNTIGVFQVSAEDTGGRPTSRVNVTVVERSDSSDFVVPAEVTAGLEYSALARVFNPNGAAQTSPNPNVTWSISRGLFYGYSPKLRLPSPAGTLSASADDSGNSEVQFRVDQTGEPVTLCAQADNGFKQCASVRGVAAAPAKVAVKPENAFPVVEETVPVEIRIEDAFDNAVNVTESVSYWLTPSNTSSDCIWRGDQATDASGRAGAELSCIRVGKVTACAQAGKWSGCAEVDFGRAPGGAMVSAALGESQSGAVTGSRLRLQVAVKNVDMGAGEPLRLKLDLKGLATAAGADVPGGLPVEPDTGRLVLPELKPGEEKTLEFEVTVSTNGGVARAKVVVEDLAGRPMSAFAEASLEVESLGLDLGGCQGAPGAISGWLLVSLAVPALRIRRRRNP